MSSYLANGKYKEAEMLGVNAFIQGDYYNQYAYQFHKVIDYYYKENQIEDLFSFNSSTISLNSCGLSILAQCPAFSII